MASIFYRDITFCFREVVMQLGRLLPCIFDSCLRENIIVTVPTSLFFVIPFETCSMTISKEGDVGGEDFIRCQR